MSIEARRTPDERFADLADFDYSPHYVDDLEGFEGLRMHYLDEGPAEAEEVFWCMHGEPTWAYLYRKMIPIFVERGARVIAPDYFGFGRSDKPVDESVYTFDFHRRAMLALLERLQPQNITLVCQDWGGLVGLTLPMEMPEAFARLIIMNTAFGTGHGKPSQGFEAWKAFVASQEDFDVGALMKRAAPGLNDDEIAAYNAPFVSAQDKAGVMTFPAIVPVSPEMGGAAISREAVAWFAEHWAPRPAFMAIGMQDPVLGPEVMRKVHGAIPGCSEPLELAQAGHFVQEHGDIVARAALDYFDNL